MERQPVDSSNLAEVGFDSESGILEIAFRSGAVWQYERVPAQVYEELMRAASVGGYFARNIRGAYDERRVE